MEFFTVPTVMLRVLYRFFIIGHDRRRILHFNIARHPTSQWIVQRLRFHLSRLFGKTELRSVGWKAADEIC